MQIKRLNLYIYMKTSDAKALKSTKRVLSGFYVYVSTKVSTFLNGLRLGFIEFVVKAFNERISFNECISAISFLT